MSDTKPASLPIATIALMRADVDGVFVKVETPPRWKVCRACGGRGWVGDARCGECDGTGEEIPDEIHVEFHYPARPHGTITYRQP